MKVKSESEVGQSCLTLRDPIDCSPPGSSIHGIFQARVLEWGAIAFSMLPFRKGQIPVMEKAADLSCLTDHGQFSKGSRKQLEFLKQGSNKRSAF